MTSPAVPEGTAPNQGSLSIHTLGEPGETVDIAFFNAQDGVKGRDGGPYLDYEERYQAEVRRAALEDREPAKYGDNVPAHVGTTLVTSAFVIDNSSTSNPSMAHKSGLEQTLTDSTFTDNNGLADPVSVLPVQLAGGEVAPVDEEDVDETVEDETPPPVVTNTPTGIPGIFNQNA
jgi:hypothetical protein